MRKHLYLFTLSLLFIVGCSSPEKLLCRTWKVDEVNFAPAKNDFEAQIQQTIKEQAPQLRFVFKTDSTYQAGKADGLSQGKWWFIDNKKGLALVAEGFQNNATIISLTKTKLVINNKDHAIKFSCSPAKGLK